MDFQQEIHPGRASCARAREGQIGPLGQNGQGKGWEPYWVPNFGPKWPKMKGIRHRIMNLPKGQIGQELGMVGQQEVEWNYGLKIYDF